MSQSNFFTCSGTLAWKRLIDCTPAPSGKRPAMPRRFDIPGIILRVWTIAEACWSRRARKRPEVKAVLKNLKQIANPVSVPMKSTVIYFGN